MFGAESLIQYGALGLFIVAFIESVFFPVPPDIILLPLSMVNRTLSFWYAFLSTAASVLGAIVGYYLGRKLGRPLLVRFIKSEKVSELEGLFKKYGGWAVGIAAFTPIPYKVFTIAGGLFKVPMTSFVLASIIGRGGRFFLEGAFVFFLGDKAALLLGGRFEILTLVLTLALILGIWVLQRTSKKKRLTGPYQVLSSLRVRLNRTFSWLVKTKEENPAFLTWAFVTAVLLSFFLPFLEDFFGPERLAINNALGPLWFWLGSHGSFLRPMASFMESPPFLLMLLLLVALSIALRRAKQSKISQGKERGFLGDFLTLGLSLFCLYIFNFALSLVLLPSLPPVRFLAPRDIVLLIPSFLFSSAAIIGGKVVLGRTLGLAPSLCVFAFLTLLFPAFWAQDGLLDAAGAGMASLSNLLSVSFFGLWASHKMMGQKEF